MRISSRYEVLSTAECLRHYVTSRMVSGLIPDEFIAFINWPNPSNLTTGLESTQPLTERSMRNVSAG
jgi:hypothetical protein